MSRRSGIYCRIEDKERFGYLAVMLRKAGTTYNTKVGDGIHLNRISISYNIIGGMSEHDGNVMMGDSRNLLTHRRAQSRENNMVQYKTCRIYSGGELRE